MVSGCVSYQSVTEYRFDERGKPVREYRVRALLYGSSGQKVKTKTVSMQKNDLSDTLIELVGESVKTAGNAAEIVGVVL